MTIKARFKLQRSEFQLNVDLEIPSRGVTAIFGDSGCGKTTLLRTIAGLEQCSNGYLKIDDILWQDQQHFFLLNNALWVMFFRKPVCLNI
jgi:molybdate transport system ATP-binding protein